MNKTSKALYAIALVAVAAVSFAVGLRSSSRVSYGANSTVSGGLSVLLSTLGDTVTVGNAAPDLTIQGNQGVLYTGGGETFGGGQYSTTTGGAGTLVPSAIFSTSTAGSLATSGNLISITPTVSGGPVVTLPASSTLASPFLANTGDTDQIWLQNASTTPGQTVVIAPSSGIQIQPATSTATTTGFVIPYNQVHRMELIRLPSTDIRAIIY